MNKAIELSQVLRGKQTHIIVSASSIKIEPVLAGQGLLENASAETENQGLPSRAAVPAAARPPP